MTLYEKQQAKDQWQDRLEQERRNISVSVEETLTVETDGQWDDEENATNERSEGLQTSEKNTALIPPRLSLQSKMLPALRSGSFVQSATAAHAAFQQAEAEKQQAKSQLSSPTNIFARLAQRLTSSFAALNVSAPEAVPPSPPSSTQLSSSFTSPFQSGQEQSLNVRERHIVPVSSHSVMRTNGQGPSSAMVIDAIPATPSTRPRVVQQQTEPQRLAGRSTKIHLQTAPPQSHTTPLPVAQHQVVKREVRDAGEPVRDNKPYELREPLVISLSVPSMPDVSKISTRPDLVAITPAMVQERAQPVQKTHTCETFFGNAVFEMGQAEVMVAQEQVQLSSVVHITLTSNPGPTLVQYISLHPQVGFTVHLTAPVSSKTTFNYALFVQPLDDQAAL